MSIVTPIFGKGSLLVHLTFWQQPFIKIIVGTTTSEIYTTYIGTAGLLLNTKWNVRNGKVDVNSFVVKCFVRCRLSFLISSGRSS